LVVGSNPTRLAARPRVAEEDRRTAMADPTTVDEYLETLPADRRTVMEDLRRTIRAAAPDAVELISYKMPAY
jgi:hypothetical protein